MFLPFAHCTLASPDMSLQAKAQPEAPVQAAVPAPAAAAEAPAAAIRPRPEAPVGTELPSFYLEIDAEPKKALRDPQQDRHLAALAKQASMADEAEEGGAWGEER